MSLKHSKQVTRFPLVRSDSTDVEAVVAIVRRLSKAHSLSEIMETVTNAARMLLAADGVTFVLREGDCCYYAEEDAISPLWKGKRFPMSACISGWCMTQRQAVAIRDIYKDDRIPIDAYRSTFVRSVMMVPVRSCLIASVPASKWVTSTSSRMRRFMRSAARWIVSAGCRDRRSGSGPLRPRRLACNMMVPSGFRRS